MSVLPDTTSQQTSTDDRVAGRWRSHVKFLLRACILFLLLPVLASVAFRAAVCFWPYPQPARAMPASSSLVLDRNDVPLAAFAATDGQWRMPVPAEQLSPRLLNAIVAVEDARFFDHHGVDWKSAGGALVDNLRAGGVRRGGSTLTMQLHRLRDPQPRGWWTKLTQAVRAEQIERVQSKQEILVEYLNRAPFGGNLVGAEAASWRYFGKPCRMLSLGESALLAGVPQNPNRLRPDRFPERAKARRHHVLWRMTDLGMITQTQANEADTEPVAARWLPLPQDRPGAPPADGALPMLLAEARDWAKPIVRTTIDADLQRQAGRAASARLAELASSGVDAVAVVVVDSASGDCLASVSLTNRRDADASQGVGIDLTQRPRSTGSVLKPLIYAGAFDAGICTPATIVDDAPAAWAGYAPSNYDRQFRGQLSAGEAMAQSRNVPAMLVLSRLGTERAVGLMESAGLRALARTPTRYGLSLAVGGAEATPMEVAEAYATLARGGVKRRLRIDAGLDAVAASDTRCLQADACWQTLTALSSPERTADVCPPAARSNVAWKTGTSSGHHDAWCAATTRRHTIVVWLGNTTGASSSALVGQEAAAPLALQLIASIEPEGRPWPSVSPVAEIRSLAAPTAGNRFTLASPADGQRIVVDPARPASGQRVLLRAVQAGGAGPIWWFVDGQSIGQSHAGDRHWWTPTPGRHEIRAVDAEGRAVKANVEVLGEAAAVAE